MDKFLETYNLLIGIKKEIGSLNRLITNKQIESVIKTLTTKSRARRLHG